MSERWCIVGEPRSGSHWLQEKINSPDAENLDEIINYPMYLEQFHDFHFYPDNFVTRRDNKSPTPQITKDEFVKKRINQIKRINPEQSLKAILFCNDYDIGHTDVIKTLKDCNFKFILLERDLFDRSISWCVLNITQVSHRFKHSSLPPANSLNDITINLGTWLSTLFREYRATEHRKKLFSNYKFITVNYENLVDDCKKNGIMLNDEDKILKTWSVQYRDVVTNIDQLRDIYNSFITNAKQIRLNQIYAK